MWRQLTAVLLLVSLFMSFGNGVYAFGYLGFSGFASQSSVDRIVVAQLEEQISRITIRWCEARKMGNVPAFELATKQLTEYKTNYHNLTGRWYAPTCTELLIDG